LTKNLIILTKTIVFKLSNIGWIWGPRSGIRKKPILDPGVKKRRILDWQPYRPE
jgi:hypothetical protein